MESLGIEIDQRKDMVLAQCTAALVGSFLATANMYTPDDGHHGHHGHHGHQYAVGREWWHSTLRSGYLLHVETVLRNSKKDQCLLEDFIIGARALEKYFIKIVDYSSGGGAEANVDIKHINAAQGSKGQGHLQINVYLGSNYPFSRLPEAIQRGALIPVKTTVFAHCPTSVPLANVSGCGCGWWLMVVDLCLTNPGYLLVLFFFFFLFLFFFCSFFSFFCSFFSFSFSFSFFSFSHPQLRFSQSLHNRINLEG